jgi:2-dehydropantoate 2-reductase
MLKRTAKKRIAIVGAGAIGGYMGTHMTRAGEDVTFIDGWAEHVQKLQSDGMHVTGMLESEAFTLPVRALHISDVPQLIREEPIDVAFIAVKSYDTAWATQLILPYLSADGVVVSMQNSINEDIIASVAGWGRTMGCIVGAHGGELVSPGVVARNTPLSNAEKPGLLVGEAHGRITRRAQHVVSLLNHAAPATTTSNLWGVRWSKLVINSMRNGVSAITGMSGKQRDTTEVTRMLTIRLGSQAVRVGQAMGLVLESAGIDLDMLALAGEGDSKALDQMSKRMVEVISARSDKQRPSMGQDILKGRRTETEFINGLVARRGAEVGIDASLHEKVNQLVKQVERGKLAPSPSVVADL